MAERSGGAWPTRFAGSPAGYPSEKPCVWRVSEWLAATLEMWCPERGCGFDSRALRWNDAVIRNRKTYRHRDELERTETLRRLTAEESIAIGEALLTSEVMRQAAFPDDDRPLSLAIALGIRPHTARMRG